VKTKLSNSIQSELMEAGIDEAGRGCLAGPVVAAAVILPKNFKHDLLNDSKQMSVVNRELLRDYICKHATSWAIGVATVDEIDSVNILQATYLAMHRAISGLNVLPQLLAIDGNRFKPYASIPHQTIIEGDAKFLHIAAASVLAKTYRDALMLELHEGFPFYGWDKNKGYGTIQHRVAMAEHGQCLHHRKSFKLKNQQLSLF
jgi:ribonuclease HII